MGPKAVYAGTFDPITNGHLDIILRAARMFETLHVAVVEQSHKSTLFSAADRIELIKQSLTEVDAALVPRVSVASFDGLLVDHVRSLGSSIVIRGLRAVSDYEYEAQMAIINRHLSDDIETAFLMTSDRCSFISSSIVREIARYGGDISGLVPKAVAIRLKQAFHSA